MSLVIPGFMLFFSFGSCVFSDDDDAILYQILWILSEIALFVAIFLCPILGVTVFEVKLHDF